MMGEGELKKRIHVKAHIEEYDYDYILLEYLDSIIDEAKKEFPSIRYKKFKPEDRIEWIDKMSNYILETRKWQKKWLGDSP